MDLKTNNLFQYVLLVAFLIFRIDAANAEGTKQLRPNAGDFGYINLMDSQNGIGTERTFALYNATADTRLNIHVKDASNEVVHLGFNVGSPNPLFFRIKDPNGNVVRAEQQVPTLAGANGFINNYNEAVAGPNTVNALGYLPISFIPTPGLNGDYSIEFRDPNHNPPTNYAKRRLELFDISVVNKTTNKAIDGRLWSKAWDITTATNSNPFNASAYIYTSDGITTKVQFKNFKAYAFVIQSNSTGTGTTSDIVENRKSIKAGVLLPEYKIFLNQPDALSFETSEVPKILSTPKIDLCNSSSTYCIDIEVTNDGVIEYIIDIDGAVGYDDPRDVRLIAKVNKGKVCLPWDARDGLGNLLSVNDSFNILIKYQAGVTNLLLHDAENNEDGFSVSHVSPVNGLTEPVLYYDDTNDDVNGLVDSIGCNQDCHAWSSNFGNEKTINSWWVTFFENDTIFDLSLSQSLVQSSVGITESHSVNCTGNKLVLEADALSNGGVSPKFSWYLNGTLSVDNIVFSPSGLENGDSISVILVPLEKCTLPDTAYFIVSIDNLVNLSLSNQEICEGKSVTLTPSLNNALAPIIYTWSPTTALTAVDASQVSVNPSLTTTYTLIVEDANECKDTSAAIVTVNSKPIVSVSSLPICQGDTAVLSSTVTKNTGTVTYAWSPSVAAFDATESSLEANPIVNTDYTLIIIDQKNCSDTVVYNQVVHAKPSLSLSDQEICEGKSVTLTPSLNNALAPIIYTWSPTTALTAVDASQVSVNPILTTTYTLVVEDANECKDTSAAIVVVNSKPIVSVSSLPICQGDTAVLSSTVTKNTGTVTYAWSPSVAAFDAKESSLEANPSVNTDYTLIIIDQKNCSDTVVYNQVVHAKPSLSLSDQEICEGKSVTLTPSLNNALAPIIYTWSPTTALTAVDASQVSVNPILTTTYTLAVEDANECKDTSSAIVTVNSKPIVSVSSLPICQGDTAVLSSTVTKNTGTVTYAWSPSVAAFDATESSLEVNPIVNTDYTLIILDQKNCSDTVIYSQVVHAKPSLSLSDQEICEGKSVTLTPSLNNALAPIIYTWSPSTALTAVDASQVSVNPILTTTYTLVVEDANECKDTSAAIVVVNSKPIVSVSSLPICQGDTSVLSSTVTKNTGTVTYAWSPSVAAFDATESSLEANPIVNTDYTLIILDQKNCSDTVVYNQVVQAKPNSPLAGKDSSICRDKIQLDANIISDGVGRWACDGGVLEDDLNPKTFLNNISDATTICKWIATNDYCLAQEDEVQIFKSGISTDAVIYINDVKQELPSITVCSNELLNLRGEPANHSNGETATWTFTNSALLNTTSDESDFGQIVLDNESLIIIKRTIKNTLQNCPDNVSTLRIDIDQLPKPVLETYGDSTICVTNPIFLLARDENASATTQYQWFKNGLVLSNQNELELENIAVSGVYKLGAKNGVCPLVFTADSLDLVVRYVPEVNAGAEKIVLVQGDLLTLNGSHTGDSSLWSSTTLNNNILLPKEASTPINLSSITGNHTFYLLAYAGPCSALDSVVLELRAPIQAPNVFTANGDGVNEYFQVKGIESYPFASLYIFNRWGDQIYESSNYSTELWDGSSYPEGAYFYVIEYGETEDKNRKHTGIVHLIR